jgi:hypothetical protein
MDASKFDSSKIPRSEMKGTLRLNPRRPTTDEAGAEDVSAHLVVDEIDFKLPSRMYGIHYQVADKARFSLTAEFLLRILKALGQTAESEIASFFSFSAEETAFVVSSAERKGYVVRNGNKVVLTADGDELFSSGADEPALYEVQRRHGWFMFDLISLCPGRMQSLSRFERALPELPLLDRAGSADARSRIKAAFRKHFTEIKFINSGKVGERSSLLSISDEIAAGERKFSIVPVRINLRQDDGMTIEPDLTEWMTGVDLDNRMSVIESCGEVLRNSVHSDASAEDRGVEVINTFVPELMKRSIRKGVFNRRDFLNLAAKLAGNIRKDRPTARIYGSLWLERNAEKIGAARRYANSKGENNVAPIIWLRPDLPNWGCSQKLQQIVDFLIEPEQEPEHDKISDSILLSLPDHNTKWRFGDVFDRILILNDGAHAPPRDLELLFQPRGFCAAMTHAPIGGGVNYPVALGFISFEPKIVSAVQSYLEQLLSHRANDGGDDLEKIFQEL